MQFGVVYALGSLMCLKKKKIHPDKVTKREGKDMVPWRADHIHLHSASSVSHVHVH